MAWIEDLDYKASDFQLNVPRWDFPDSGVT